LQRIAGLGGKAQAASGQLAAKAAAGGKAQAASGQLAAKAAAGRKAQAASRQLAAKAAAADGDAPADGRYMRWSEEETAYLLQMVEKHGQKWTRILKEDGKDGGAKKFADGRTARQLLDKYRGLNRKAQAASGQLAAKAAAGRKAQAASRQLAAKAAAADGDAPADGTWRRYMRWSEEETAYLLQMVEKHGQKWTRILKEDGKDGGAKKFADGLTARQLLDKYGGLNRKTKPGARKTKPRAAAAEATDHA
jgi:hypothetical protein